MGSLSESDADAVREEVLLDVSAERVDGVVGVEVGVAVGVGVADAVAFGVLLGVALGVGEALGFAVAVGVGVVEATAFGVLEGVALGVGDALGTAVTADVGVAVGVGVGVEATALRGAPRSETATTIATAVLVPAHLPREDFEGKGKCSSMGPHRVFRNGRSHQSTRTTEKQDELKIS